MQKLKIKRLSELAKTPTRAHKGDAGLDLYSIEDFLLKPGERHLFKTNVSMEIPEGYYGRIADRSGNAYSKGLHTIAGVIDETYRGDVGVVLVNLGLFGVLIERGHRVAQIIIEKYFDFPIEEVAETEVSVMGESGFGASGN